MWALASATLGHRSRWTTPLSWPLIATTGKETEMTSKYLTIPVVAGALGLGSIVVAQAAEPTAAELMSQIQALQAKVQTLETNQQQAVTKADVDATVESVLKDADKQSQLMQMEGFTAG